jgi:predicted enzyme related to lactoylglutathione lyase
MAYTNNKFCWHGVISSDTAKTTPFYEKVLGWTAQTVDMGGEPTTMFAASDEVARAHTRAPQTKGEPNYWSSYLRVKDVDSCAAAATAKGGNVLVPATDIAPGRFAVVTSPSGAAFNLFHEVDSSATNAGDGEGSIHWVELHSTDVEADLAWLNAIFGITTQSTEMPGVGTYYILLSGKDQVGGCVAQQNGGVPSMWLPWVKLEEVDAAVETAQANGGHVLGPPFDVPGVGRMSILADPVGGVFGVIKPAPPQS